MSKRKLFEIGGIASGVILVAFGIASLVLANPARDLWITSTALTTTLNTAYLSERISLFGIVVGVALLLSGIGFLVLAVGGALRQRTEATPSAA